jgi:hypothetical protein
MFSSALVEKHRAVLRHDADALAQVGQRQVAHRHAVDAHRALLRVVEAQQQLQHRALAGAAGADQRHGFAGPDLQRKWRQREACSGRDG